MTDSQTLLAEYAKNGSEAAFRELVARYLDLVHSAAMRLVNGDAHRAQDVAQAVFVDLARAARTLNPEVMLGGWLHRHTCFVASKTMRTERRRQVRERQAMEMNALDHHADNSLTQLSPLLDDAINELPGRDREAVLLRYFEQRDFRAVGAALGSTEDAARVRVNRALDRLHTHLKQRGVTLSAAALATALASQVITAAPAGLAASISGAALAGAVTATGLSINLMKLLAMTKIQLGTLGAIVIAGVATPLIIQHEKRQADLNTALREQVQQLTAENDRLANLPPVASTVPATNDNLSDLLRLRNEVNQLRQQTNGLARLQAENQRLQAAQAKPARGPVKPPPDDATQVSYPKDSWVFAGYADPQSSFRSAVWSRGTGDLKTYLGSLTPQELELERERVERRMKAEGKSEAEVAAAIVKEDFSKVEGFRILETKMASNDLMILHVYVDGINQEQQAKLKLVGTEWKFDGWAER